MKNAKTQKRHTCRVAKKDDDDEDDDDRAGLSACTNLHVSPLELEQPTADAHEGPCLCITMVTMVPPSSSLSSNSCAVAAEVGEMAEAEAEAEAETGAGAVVVVRAGSMKCSRFAATRAVMSMPARRRTMS